MVENFEKLPGFLGKVNSELNEHLVELKTRNHQMVNEKSFGNIENNY